MYWVKVKSLYVEICSWIVLLRCLNDFVKDFYVGIIVNVFLYLLVNLCKFVCIVYWGKVWN